MVLAFFTLAVLGNVLRLTRVSTEMQSIATGALLILSVVVPMVAQQLKLAIERVRRDRHPPSVGHIAGAEAAGGEEAI